MENKAMTTEEHEAKKGFDRNVVRLTEQVKETYKKAFFDLLEKKVAADPPDYEWITRLYNEIKVKFITILKEGSSLRKEIEECMDVELFDQMIRNEAFDPADMYKLICYTFEKCKQLGSPARDQETDEKKQEIIDLVNSGKGQFSVVVPLFIKNINHCVDLIYEDLQALSEKFKKK